MDVKIDLNLKDTILDKKVGPKNSQPSAGWWPSVRHTTGAPPNRTETADTSPGRAEKAAADT